MKNGSSVFGSVEMKCIHHQWTTAKTSTSAAATWANCFSIFSSVGAPLGCTTQLGCLPHTSRMLEDAVSVSLHALFPCLASHWPVGQSSLSQICTSFGICVDIVRTHISAVPSVGISLPAGSYCHKICSPVQDCLLQLRTRLLFFSSLSLLCGQSSFWLVAGGDVTRHVHARWAWLSTSLMEQLLKRGFAAAAFSWKRFYKSGKGAHRHRRRHFEEDRHLPNRIRQLQRASRQESTQDTCVCDRDCILSRSSLNRISSLSVVGMSAWKQSPAERR